MRVVHRLTVNIDTGEMTPKDPWVITRTRMGRVFKLTDKTVPDARFYHDNDIVVRLDGQPLRCCRAFNRAKQQYYGHPKYNYWEKLGPISTKEINKYIDRFGTSN